MLKIDNKKWIRNGIGGCLLSVFIGLATIISFEVYADEGNDGTITEKNDVLKAITIRIRSHEGINYVNWTVKGQDSDDLFLVQRALNDGEFKTVDFVFGLPVNPVFVLGHSFIDHNPPLGKLRYRIKIISKKESVMHSKSVINITSETVPNALANNLNFL